MSQFEPLSASASGQESRLPVDFSRLQLGNSIPEAWRRLAHARDQTVSFTHARRPGMEFRAEVPESRLEADSAERQPETLRPALGWLWARSDKMIPIPGFKTVAQVEENAGAMRFGALSVSQMNEIAALLKG